MNIESRLTEIELRLKILETILANQPHAAGDDNPRLDALEDRVAALESPKVQTEYPDASPKP